MPNADLLIATDETALNVLLGSLYQNDSNLFYQRIEVNRDGLNSIQCNIIKQPVLSLGPDPLMHAQAVEFVKNSLAAGHADETLAAVLNPAVTITCPNVLIFDLETGKGGQGSLVFGGNFISVPAAGGGYNILLTASHATITIIDDPALSSLYTTVLAPQLVQYYNSGVFPMVALPTSIPLAGITFSAPTIYSGGKVLTIATAIGPASPSPASTAVDTGNTELIFDAALMNAVISKFNLQETIGYSGGIPTPNLSWDYHVTATPGTITFEANEMVIPMTLDGGANFTFHTPGGLPNISFSGGIDGSCTATATMYLEADTNHNIDVILRTGSIGGFNVHPSIDHLPSFLNSVISDITSKLASEVVDMLTDNFGGTNYTLFTLSPVPVNRNTNQQTAVTIQNPKLSILPNQMKIEGVVVSIPTIIIG